MGRCYGGGGSDGVVSQPFLGNPSREPCGRRDDGIRAFRHGAGPAVEGLGSESVALEGTRGGDSVSEDVV